MATDIKLNEGTDNNWVSIEAQVVDIKAADLILESGPRRSENGGTLRRALVHGVDDSLIVNFNGDYPGGTSIARARINLHVDVQSSPTPALPKTAEVGDVRLVRNRVSLPVHGEPFGVPIEDRVTLWVSVGKLSHISPIALWSPIPLSDSVEGTI